MGKPFQQENASELMHELSSTLEKAYSTILRRLQKKDFRFQVGVCFLQKVK